MSADADPYFKKVVTYAYRGRRLRFRVAQELFSSQDIDVGTQRLLRSLLDVPLPATARILDLGCGYGPLGLTLAADGPGRMVQLVDRDALAVAYAGQNARLNDLPNTVVTGSLGYDRTYGYDGAHGHDTSLANEAANAVDCIVSNIPAKAGEAAITALLLGGARRLRPGGLVAVVVVTRLEALIDRLLADPAIVVLKRVAWPGHLVLHYRFAGLPADLPPTANGSADVLSPYWHGQSSLAVGGARLTLATVIDVAEAAAPSIATDLLIEVLTGLRGAAANSVVASNVVAFNVGQGAVPVAAARLLRPRRLTLLDRDLLALAVARQNVVAHTRSAIELTVRHQVGLAAGPAETADIVVGCLRADESQAVQAHVIEQAAQLVADDGLVLVAGASTPMARLDTLVHARTLLVIHQRLRRKGHTALVLRRPRSTTPGLPL